MAQTDEISPAKRAAARIDARLAITGAVGHLFERLAKEGGLNQSRIADRLGLSRARISKILSNPGNWTLDTVGDLLAAMDGRITRVDVENILDVPPSNYVHQWLVEAGQKLLPVSPPKDPVPAALNSLKTKWVETTP